jgi:MYXO-CTERM domain-containing protein
VAASPVLAWSPATTAIAFGDAGVGDTPPSQSLTLTNQGPGAVTLQQFTIAGAQAADFSLGSTGTCVANASLPQGSSCSLALEFQPGAAGARSATLSVASSGTNPPDVALSGNGTALAQAAINVVPGAITFTVNSNASSVDPQTLSLENTGNAVLHVSAVRIASGAFTLEPAAVNGCAVAPFDLLPGQACSLLVGWSGTAADSQSGVVEIDSTAASTPMQVALQAVPATGAAADATTISNVGGGGCSIASGRSLTDPMLWLLALLAAIVLWRRRGGPR